MTHPTRALSGANRPALQAHFLALGAEDRRLRFGQALDDARLRTYVDGIDFPRDTVPEVSNETLRLVGVAHVAHTEGHVEHGLSVLEDWRGRGVGAALMARGHLHARNGFVRMLFMHCLRENAAMMHLARKQGMRVAVSAGEADAFLEIPRTDARSLAQGVMEEHVGLFDHALKTQVAAAKRVMDAMGRRKD